MQIGKIQDQFVIKMISNQEWKRIINVLLSHHFQGQECGHGLTRCLKFKVSHEIVATQLAGAAVKLTWRFSCRGQIFKFTYKAAVQDFSCNWTLDWACYFSPNCWPEATFRPLPSGALGDSHHASLIFQSKVARDSKPLDGSHSLFIMQTLMG